MAEESMRVKVRVNPRRTPPNLEGDQDQKRKLVGDRHRGVLLKYSLKHSIHVAFAPATIGY